LKYQSSLNAECRVGEICNRKKQGSSERSVCGLIEGTDQQGQVLSCWMSENHSGRFVVKNLDTD